MKAGGKQTGLLPAFRMSPFSLTNSYQTNAAWNLLLKLTKAMLRKIFKIKYDASSSMGHLCNEKRWDNHAF